MPNIFLCCMKITFSISTPTQNFTTQKVLFKMKKIKKDLRIVRDIDLLIFMQTYIYIYIFYYVAIISLLYLILPYQSIWLIFFVQSNIVGMLIQKRLYFSCQEILSYIKKIYTYTHTFIKIIEKLSCHLNSI